MGSGSDSEYYLFECPKCGDVNKHKGKVLDKAEGENIIVLKVKCEDCNSVGLIKILKPGNIEIFDFD
ncbi:hypothetical protein Asulf_01758 [Archaeoglobus sulfaticallidus PM70-1]|uniref:Uncharacterized protein n=1 Tax=Archaeoglobus sulfaticallidus PM70-1 TaxID=387631 RepID=N0BDL6_9EURY|nr:hypothetical protein [Archaeoglobus sulfaticallidus]AGK61729.1 hypothetical protein Asulf_01758 [Archaeoglobus sulfaticallidus PM70-1]